ncbi:MAG: fused MFS/spermidine synthase [Candidatus Aureabacteria bacterium]|nr:fused MFS/spermidine synthase [Candidatus Auribacterota bacterium]
MKRVPLIFTAFFLSGFAALIYEVVWSRMLALIFGATVYAQSIVLGLFMGGLAAGSIWIGNHMPFSKRPLFCYGLLEGLVGFFGLFSIYFLPFAHQFCLQNDFLDFGFKLLICTLCILPPTVAMGGTFPVLYKSFLHEKENPPLRILSNLYVINTFGAVTGILVSGYFLISRIGLQHTLGIAVSVNLFLFFLFLKIRENTSSSERLISRSSDSQAVNVKILAGLFLAGFCTMLYEITWSRALNFSFGSSTYTFSLILFTFLLGLGLGAAWIKRKTGTDTVEQKMILSDLQTKIFLAASIFIFFALRIPLITQALFEYTHGIYWKVILAEFILLFMIMAPSAFFIGASFPLLCSLVPKKGEPDEKSVGLAYCVNTLGAIAGALSTGFWFMAKTGPFKAIWIAAAIHWVIMILVAPVPFGKKLTTNHLLFILGIFFLWKQFSLSQKEDILTGFYSGTYSGVVQQNPRYLSDNPHYQYAKKNKKSKTASKTLWCKHGLISSVAVLKSNLNTALVIDGKVDASVGDFFESDMPTQSFLALLPLMLSNRMERGLVVGYGSGVTAGILCRHVQHLDCLEIEKAVMEASPFFEPFNLSALQSKNIHLILGDARRYIRMQKEKYDFISAEPSNIWVSGVAHLFTREYFQDCKHLLTEKGVLVQWIHVYKLSLDDFQTALRTFSSVFPTFEIWGSFNYGDVFLVGWKKKKSPLIREKYDSIMQNLYYKKEMNQIGAGTFEEFNRFRIQTGERIKTKIQPGPIHTDDLPVLEFSAAKNMFKIEAQEIYRFLEEI